MGSAFLVKIGYTRQMLNDKSTLPGTVPGSVGLVDSVVILLR